MAGFMIIIQDTGILSRYSVDSTWMGCVSVDVRRCLVFSTRFLGLGFGRPCKESTQGLVMNSKADVIAVGNDRPV